MERADKEAAEATLRQLLIGAQVVGVTWYPGVFTIRFDSLDSALEQRARQPTSEVAITIESRWTVFPTVPSHLPASAEELPDAPLDHQVAALARLAGQRIARVALGERCPHLVLEFDQGAVLFLNGHHDRFECWNLWTGNGVAPQDWLIVATPGDGLAVFAPNDETRPS